MRAWRNTLARTFVTSSWWPEPCCEFTAIHFPEARMLRFVWPAVVASALLAGCSDPTAVSTSMVAASSAHFDRSSANGKAAFGFNGTAKGFPTGAVRLTGGGAYDPATASNTIGATTFAHTSGGFDCTATIAQGPLAGCAAGEGVRWDTAQLLASTMFKCTGAAAEAAKPAATNAHTVVLLADFYRAGDGIDESFTAQMIVSDVDLAPDIPGLQTLWVQGVGCGDANAHFNS